ncbi:hypothetical protein NXU84_04095 [Parabacteroides distasonis]|nr:hypothetical protein [Parabacteroides distasonis]
MEQDADTVAFISRLSVVNIHEDPDTHLPTRGEGHDPAGQEPPRRAGTRALHAQRGRDLLLGRHPAGMRPQGPGSGA